MNPRGRDVLTGFRRHALVDARSPVLQSGEQCGHQFPDRHPLVELSGPELGMRRVRRGHPGLGLTGRPGAAEDLIHTSIRDVVATPVG